MAHSGSCIIFVKNAFEKRGSVVDNTRWFVNSFLAVLGCDIDTIYLPSLTDAARRCVCVLLKCRKRWLDCCGSCGVPGWDVLILGCKEEQNTETLQESVS